MMKNQIFRRFLYLLPALFWPLIASAGNPVELFSTPASPETSCPAPPPAWIAVTEMTPTSISLEWSSSGQGGGAVLTPKFYRVEGYDVTANNSLSTYITTDTTITYDYLEIGHTYHFDVSASYCPAGPFGQKISIEETTGYIIVDIIMELENPCTPDTRQGTGPGVTFDFCVQQSASPQEPYTNGFVGLLQIDDNNILQFGIAGVGSRVIVGPMEYNGNDPDPDFEFPWDPDAPPTDEIPCLYLGQPVFTVKYLGAFTNVPGPLSMRITFQGSYENFSYCGSYNQQEGDCVLPSRPSATGSSGSFTPAQIASLLSKSKAFGQSNNGIMPSKAALRSSDITLIYQPNPNPFSRSVALTYGIEEAGPVAISLCDAMGRLVRTVENTAMQPAGQYNILIDGTGLPDGVYFLHLLTGESRKVFALVKRE